MPYDNNRATTVAVALLMVAVATTRADAASGLGPVDLGRLAALADQLRADVQARPDATVLARVRTAASGAGPAAAGCGYAFLADDDPLLSAHVPRIERATCNGSAHGQGVQFVRPDAVYEAAVTTARAGGADNVTFTSNGGDGLPIDTLCLGFGGGDALAFCVDRRLLDACAPRGDAVFLGPDGGAISLSRAFAGRAAPNCKEIVFRDVRGLARGFGSLVRGGGDDDDALAAVCSRIGLQAETSAWAYDADKCYARREHAKSGGFYYVKMDASRLRDGCTRTTDHHGDVPQ